MDSGKGSSSPKYTRTCSRFRRWEIMSPIRYLKLVGGKMVASALRIMYPRSSRSRKVSSSSENAATKMPPQAVAAARLAIDSHRAEAVKDCIHFMNNISSVPRSNSLPSKP